MLSSLKHKIRLFRSAMMGTEGDFTQGSIDRAIILLSIPMVMEMLMESLFALVDAYFVSKISKEAIAAIGITESLLMLVYSIAIGLSAAATAVVARRIGEKNPEAASRAGAQAILIAVVLSFCVALPSFFGTRALLEKMSNDPLLVETGLSYTKILLVFNLPILLLWMLNGVLRGAGDAATAMRALWLANGINIILDPCFIFGWGPFPELGVMGAAVATSIGRSAGVVYQLYKLTRKDGVLRLLMSYFRPVKALILRLVQLAAGGAGQYLIASSSWVFMVYILSHLGTSIVAGYTLAIRLIIFAILPSWGMANAAATLVGQNLGAKQAERAEQSAWRSGHINMIFMICVSVIYFVFAPQLIAFFDPNPAVVQSGTLALRFIAAGYSFYGYGMILTQALNGAGDTRTPSLLNILCFWCIEIPLAYLLVYQFEYGEMGVYFSIVFAESILALLAIVIFNQGKWKKIEV